MSDTSELLPTLTRAKAEEIFQLWDDMAAFGAADVDDAMLFLMKALAKLIDADSVMWAGSARLAVGAQARRDPMNGWRAVTARFTEPNTQEELDVARAMREQESEPAMNAAAIAHHAGTLRVHRWQDKGFLDMKAFKKTEHYRYMHEAYDIRDCLYAITPVKQDAESCFLFDKIGRDDKFTQADADTMLFTLRGLKWFQKEIMLANGLGIAQEPLSPAERRIIRHLLTRKTEREIAEAMGQSYQTTHGYVKSILRKYGVSRRQGLMALWLARS